MTDNAHLETVTAEGDEVGAGRRQASEVDRRKAERGVVDQGKGVAPLRTGQQDSEPGLVKDVQVGNTGVEVGHRRRGHCGDPCWDKGLGRGGVEGWDCQHHQQ